MVRNTGSQLRDSPFGLAGSALAEQIGQTLRNELGASRRATKTVMRWTGVSDRTARSWLNGRVSPSGLHLLALAAYSWPVMLLVLRLTGHRDLEVGLEAQEIEARLELALAHVQAIRSS
jgi:hypothetical protein